jgi:hypothetical protein
MSIRRLAIVLIALIAALPGSPVPLPVLAQSPDPCAAALGASSSTAMRTAPDRLAKHGPLGADTRDVRDLLHFSSSPAQARSRAASRLREDASARQAVRPMADRDENEIAILEDRGDLISRPNPFDLANTGLRFEPAGGGYSVTSTSAEFRAALGRRVTLGDDDSVAQTIAFPFEFYGRRFTSLFLNSDGNLTFEEGDNASTARGITRLTSGAPRIAPFFADLDPSVGGGIFLDSAADVMTITWCAVPGFGLPLTTNVQALLFPGGAVEFRFRTVTLGDGIVALSPGRTGTFNAVDLSAGAAPSTEPVATGEQFLASASLDLVAASRRFYATHPDNFDQLVFWTDTPVISDAFAFESTISNAITGTGLDVVDFSGEFGSGGALQSVINMDRISKYRDTPSAKLFGEISTLGVLAHETGHRWLARLRFLDADRALSDQLLGRQLAHWSFFVDTDGSVMEGNEIEDLGGGAFRTAAATEKYSRLDLYAMGLATEAEVPRWFYIDAARAGNDREAPPIVGVPINGTRRDVLIQDVIDAMGPRVPAAGDSPRLHRQAFVFVRRATAVQDPQDFARLVRIREQFGPFFSRATENRMTVRTTLQP